LHGYLDNGNGKSFIVDTRYSELFLAVVEFWQFYFLSLAAW